MPQKEVGKRSLITLFSLVFGTLGHFLSSLFLMLFSSLFSSLFLRQTPFAGLLFAAG